IIKTSYDRKRRSNVRFPAKTNRRENIVWTEGERVKAEAGEVVQDIDDLHSKVKLSLQNETYINSPFSGGLDLRNSDGSLMAFVCSSLPEVIRRNLTSNLLACFDGREVL
ncbi:hypothetical protein CY34DRAFT_52722, partial [Suillus luteus UH-Slu-Lm8-n1]